MTTSFLEGPVLFDADDLSLEALFAPRTDRKVEVQLTAPAGSTPAEAASDPGAAPVLPADPEQLAQLLLEGYSPEQRYALICALLRPPSAEPEPEPEPEPKPEPDPLPTFMPARPSSARVETWTDDDGMGCSRARQTEQLRPESSFPQWVWTKGEAAGFLGCTISCISSRVERINALPGGITGHRIYSECGTRMIERSVNVARWTLVRL